MPTIFSLPIPDSIEQGPMFFSKWDVDHISIHGPAQVVLPLLSRSHYGIGPNLTMSKIADNETCVAVFPFTVVVPLDKKQAIVQAVSSHFGVNIAMSAVSKSVFEGKTRRMGTGDLVKILLNLGIEHVRAFSYGMKSSLPESMWVFQAAKDRRLTVTVDLGIEDFATDNENRFIPLFKEIGGRFPIYFEGYKKEIFNPCMVHFAGCEHRTDMPGTFKVQLKDNYVSNLLHIIAYPKIVHIIKNANGGSEVSRYPRSFASFSRFFNKFKRFVSDIDDAGNLCKVVCFETRIILSGNHFRDCCQVWNNVLDFLTCFAIVELPFADFKSVADLTLDKHKQYFYRRRLSRPLTIREKFLFAFCSNMVGVASGHFYSILFSPRWRRLYKTFMDRSFPTMGYFHDSYFLQLEAMASDDFPTIVGTDNQIRTDWHLVGEVEMVDDNPIPFAFHFPDVESDEDEASVLPRVSILPGDLDFMDEDEVAAEINEEELLGALSELLLIRTWRNRLRSCYKTGGTFTTGATGQEVIQKAVGKIKEKMEEDDEFVWEYDLKLRDELD